MSLKISNPTRWGVMRPAPSTVWPSQLLPALMLSVVGFGLAGCQGLEWSSDESPTPATSPTPSVDPTPTLEPGATDALSVTLTAGTPAYFSFGSRTTVSPSTPESSMDWDLRLQGNALHLNGGESGSGQAWGLGPVGIGEADYEALSDHDDVVGPVQIYDEFESVLTDWYQYIVSGATHGVYSRYHVYAIQVDAEHTYKLQILDYYDDVNGSLESGMITFRWSALDEDAATEVLLDARAGGAYAEEDDPDNKYTYYSFGKGVVDLTDEEAATSTAWDIAFKRYYVKLNGGVSGPKGVMGYDFQASREETTSEIKAFTPESELPEFEAASAAAIDGAWTSDRIGSVVQGSYQLDPSGKPSPSNEVYVLTNAADSKYYKFLVTDLATGADGQVSSVTFRLAEIR